MNLLRQAYLDHQRGRQARLETERIAERVRLARDVVGRGFNNLSGAIRSKRNNLVVDVDVTSSVSVDTIRRRLNRKPKPD